MTAPEIPSAEMSETVEALLRAAFNMLQHDSDSHEEAHKFMEDRRQPNERLHNASLRL